MVRKNFPGKIRKSEDLESLPYYFPVIGLLAQFVFFGTGEVKVDFVS